MSPRLLTESRRRLSWLYCLVTPTQTHTSSVTTRAITLNYATMTIVRNDSTRIGSRIFINARMWGSLADWRRSRPVIMHPMSRPARVDDGSLRHRLSIG